MKNFNLFNNNRDLYTKMLSDIEKAKKHVFLETYIFHYDKIGKKFIEILSKKVL